MLTTHVRLNPDSNELVALNVDTIFVQTGIPTMSKKQPFLAEVAKVGTDGDDLYRPKRNSALA